MKKNVYIVLLLISLYSCSEPPTQFTKEVSNDAFVDLNGNSVEFKDILKKHEGKQIVIDVWASWCKDCIVGMPDLKALQDEFTDTDFVFLSVDRHQNVWKRSIKKYKLQGDHYFIPSGQKGIFGDFLNSNWIPRYMVVDYNGNIILFKAKKANDKHLKKALQ